MKIGILSDTHGILRERVVDILKCCEVIIHAGDIGNQEILETLREIAPVYVVKGNNDKGEWSKLLPERLSIMLKDTTLFIIHDLKQYDRSKEYDIVISGHSHKVHITHEGRQLFINPGGCGKRRFTLPLTCVTLDIEEDKKINIHYID